MRQLTVSTLFRPDARTTRVPHLRLTGQWLEAAGFTPGSKVRVRIDAGQLVISRGDSRCRYCGRPSEDGSGVCERCYRRYESR